VLDSAPDTPAPRVPCTRGARERDNEETERRRSPEPAATDPLNRLALAAQQGDRESLEALSRRLHPRLTRVALALGTPPDDVPDVVQETLLTAWKNLHLFDSARGSLMGWILPGLRGRVLNRARGHGRRSRLARALERWLTGRRQRIVPDQEAVEARLTLAKLVGGLTPRQREVVAFYELEGLSARETGRLLGISAAGVRSIARQAVQRLKSEARRLRDAPSESKRPTGPDAPGGER
jgi:RNA polymerase sigma-70 factor (ECF subfamily)